MGKVVTIEIDEHGQMLSAKDQFGTEMQVVPDRKLPENAVVLETFTFYEYLKPDEDETNHVKGHCVYINGVLRCG